jgi:hypothetical protein
VYLSARFHQDPMYSWFSCSCVCAMGPTIRCTPRVYRSNSRSMGPVTQSAIRMASILMRVEALNYKGWDHGVKRGRRWNEGRGGLMGLMRRWSW